jgi:hypothetical protein
MDPSSLLESFERSPRVPTHATHKEDLMRLMKTLCCAAALVACLAPGARADEWNKKTILTFSGPVQIPGATLAAGNRHVVQVFDQTEKKVYGTILAIPDERVEPVSKPIVLFSERPANTPQAIKSWFYPGERIGNEFVYPRNQAMKIARETHQGVLATEEPYSPATTASTEETMKSAKVTRVDENGRSAAEASASVPPEIKTPGRDAMLKNSSGNTATSSATAGSGTVGTSGQTEAQSSAPAPKASRRTRLPQTASNLPLFELLSASMLAGAFGVHIVRMRRIDVSNIAS